MVSDKPPRRSRSGKTPVTLDLSADKAVDQADPSAIAEPVRSDDTDDTLPKTVADAGSLAPTGSKPAAPSLGESNAKPVTAESPAQSVPADGNAAPSLSPASGAPLADKITHSAAASVPVDAEKAATAAKTDTTKLDTTKTDTAKEAAFVTGAPKTSATDAKPEDPAPKIAGSAGPTSVPPGGKPASSVFPGASSSSSGASASPSSSRASAAVPPAARGASGASLAAAGIVGGLVALLLAGSMQYAGYLPGPAASNGNGAVSAEIADLRQQLASLRNAPATGTDSDLAARVSALETSIGNNGTAPEVTERLSSLQRDIEALRTSTKNDDAAAADLGQRLSGIETRLNKPGPEQAIARALAAAALKAATERGGSFAAELQTFADVAADDPAVEGLRAFAVDGVPTRADLVRRLPAATDAMMDALHQPAEGEGIASRLLSSAMRVVKVRPVGDVAGETPEAVVARIEDRVKAGNLQAAVSEWNALPEAAKQASQDFRRALDARIKVDELASGTLTRAMTSTGTAG
ncbi:hypothetical protein J2858_003263 [Neorhizobium galegae]|uniref:COG4223 family protein n=1 Tax=Neorhizobium galegae TaxID=399 RepID=UPI001AE90D62|nr:hypothetical protein [Neorhizobium galegae]MBP2550327.1 hypothetical protein [Neorhizobium galegae]